MSQADARGYLGNLTGTTSTGHPWTGGMYYHLRGDGSGSHVPAVYGGDFTPDASLPTRIPGRYLYATSEGLAYHREFTISSRALNEDPGWYDDQNEIYASATFIDGDMGHRIAHSSVIVRDF